jgi:hypothetical protein
VFQKLPTKNRISEKSLLEIKPSVGKLGKENISTLRCFALATF